jgi:8-oxo-dGTP pyrophosphatase MutT (NUDIX family)
MQRTTWDGLAVSDSPPFGASIVVWRRRAGVHEFLLLHRLAPGGPAFEGDWAWTPPSGARLNGEEIDDTAHRELREETGLDLPCMPLDLGSEDWVVYVAEAPADALIRLDAEHDRFEWVPADRAVARCRPDVVASGLAAVAAWLVSQASR